MREIFFDLDDTLIDTSERHYRLYRDILDILRLPNTLSKEEFWNKKRAGNKTLDLLPEDASPNCVPDFLAKWVEKIEDKEYLNYDVLYPKSIEVLSQLKCKFDLRLITMRHNETNLFWELDNFSLTKYFKQVVHGSYLKFGDKTQLIQSCTKSYPEMENGIIIGDSEMDIEAAKKLGLLTIGVTYGIRSRDFLKKLEPSFLVDSLPEILKILDSINE